jgi:hypothetical protein
MNSKRAFNSNRANEFEDDVFPSLPRRENAQFEFIHSLSGQHLQRLERQPGRNLKLTGTGAFCRLDV